MKSTSGASMTSVSKFFDWFVWHRNALKKWNKGMISVYIPSRTGGGAKPRKGNVAGAFVGDWDKN